MLVAEMCMNEFAVTMWQPGNNCFVIFPIPKTTYTVMLGRAAWILEIIEHIWMYNGTTGTACEIVPPRCSIH